jgi:D-alanine-D-alanine ligase
MKEGGSDGAKGKVVVLHDWVPETGAPDHADVLTQARVVSSALKELGYEPVAMGISLDLKAAVEELVRVGPLLVFNLVESLEGQGRFIYFASALLDGIGIPYTGSNTDALYTTSNKFLSKQRMVDAHIAVPRGFSLRTLQSSNLRTEREYIIKSVWEHASVGIEEDAIVMGNAEELLKEALSRRKILGGDCFVEEFIEGREFNLSLLEAEDGPHVLPPAEITFEAFPPGKRRVVGYRAKWDQGSFEYHHTPRRFDFPRKDDSLLKELKEIARRCWDLFGLAGYARVDFRVHPVRGPHVLEINTNPCLSPDAGFVASAERGGLSLTEVVERIVIASRKEEFPGTPLGDRPASDG